MSQLARGARLGAVAKITVFTCVVTVALAPIASAFVVTKSANRRSVRNGGLVTYTVTVECPGMGQDCVLTGLTDSDAGDLIPDVKPVTIPAGRRFTAIYHQKVQGSPGSIHVNEVTAGGTRGETTVFGSAEARVRIRTVAPAEEGDDLDDSGDGAHGGGGAPGEEDIDTHDPPDPREDPEQEDDDGGPDGADPGDGGRAGGDD